MGQETTLSVKDIELLIKQRNEARKAKDFQKADEIREKLDKNNVILEDVKGETTWRVKK